MSPNSPLIRTIIQRCMLTKMISKKDGNVMQITEPGGTIHQSDTWQSQVDTLRPALDGRAVCSLHRIRSGRQSAPSQEASYGRSPLVDRA